MDLEDTVKNVNHLEGDYRVHMKIPHTTLSRTVTITITAIGRNLLAGLVTYYTITFRTYTINREIIAI